MTLPSGRTPYLPAAPYYDGATRDWKLDASGQYRGVHPNDQAMAMSLCMRKGDCSASPDVGNTLHTMPFVTGDDVAAEIERHVRTSYPCSRMLAEGKVRIDSIEHEVRPVDGALAVVVKYTNLDTSQRGTSEWYTE